MKKELQLQLLSGVLCFRLLVILLMQLTYFFLLRIFLFSRHFLVRRLPLGSVSLAFCVTLLLAALFAQKIRAPPNDVGAVDELARGFSSRLFFFYPEL